MLTETLQAESFIEQYYAVSISQDGTGRASLTDWNNFYSVASTIGIATNRANPGTNVTVCLMGIIENTNWDFVPNKPVYAFASGVLTQNLPPKNVYRIGNAISKTKIFVKPSEFIMVNA